MKDKIRQWTFRHSAVQSFDRTVKSQQVAEVLDEDNCLVIEIWHPKDCDLENLRLIAAAPDLLAACEAMADAFAADNQPCCDRADRLGLGRHSSGCPKIGAYMKCRVALFKAKPK
jgi:hypothetical protein